MSQAYQHINTSSALNVSPGSKLVITPATPFHFEGTGVRVVDLGNGEPWFVATDVARILGYRDAANMTRNLEPDERGTHNLSTALTDLLVAVVSEPGLYHAINSRRSSSKLAHSVVDRIARFQRWVNHEVLPTIRKTGSYGQPAAPTATDVMALLKDPTAALELIGHYARQNLALQDKVAETGRALVVAKSRVADAQAKVHALARISDARGSMCITDAAKVLQVKPAELFAHLRWRNWTYVRSGRPDVAYQDKINAGLLIHKLVPSRADDNMVFYQVRVTPKGIAKLAMDLSPRLF